MFIRPHVRRHISEREGRALVGVFFLFEHHATLAASAVAISITVVQRSLLDCYQIKIEL